MLAGAARFQSAGFGGRPWRVTQASRPARIASRDQASARRTPAASRAAVHEPNRATITLTPGRRSVERHSCIVGRTPCAAALRSAAAISSALTVGPIGPRRGREPGRRRSDQEPRSTALQGAETAADGDLRRTLADERGPVARRGRAAVLPRPPLESADDPRVGPLGRGCEPGCLRRCTPGPYVARDGLRGWPARPVGVLKVAVTGCLAVMLGGPVADRCKDRCLVPAPSREAAMRRQASGGESRAPGAKLAHRDRRERQRRIESRVRDARASPKPRRGACQRIDHVPRGPRLPGMRLQPGGVEPLAPRPEHHLDRGTRGPVGELLLELRRRSVGAAAHCDEVGASPYRASHSRSRASSSSRV